MDIRNFLYLSPNYHLDGGALSQIGSQVLLNSALQENLTPSKDSIMLRKNVKYFLKRLERVLLYGHENMVFQ